MGPRDAFSSSLDAHVGITFPQQRRSGSPKFQSRIPSVSTGTTQTLPFMSFDFGSAPPSFPPSTSGYTASATIQSFENEPPLLEELGINTNVMMRKTLTILNPLKVNPYLHEDADLSGPFLFCLLFGLFQLLAGKIIMGVILGWITVASMFLYVVSNLLAGHHGTLDLYRCVSLVGYCLLPMVIFSAISLFIPHEGFLIFTVASLAVIWCTRACTSLLVVLAPIAEEHRSLVAYACALIYTAFSLLVVF